VIAQRQVETGKVERERYEQQQDARGFHGNMRGCLSGWCGQQLASAVLVQLDWTD
jgi:hypothetical protein